MKKAWICMLILLAICLCACGRQGADPGDGAPQSSSGAHVAGKDPAAGIGTLPSAGGAAPNGQQFAGKELVLATLNIKYGAEGLEKVAEAIRQVSPDIIGLQEVDVGCRRSAFADEPAELARMAGYPYHAFAKATSVDGGAYGTALLSRYPIEAFEVIPLDSGSREARSFGHAVICVEDLRLDVFVTHLSYENPTIRAGQMKTIGNWMAGAEYYALLGDLNCFDLAELSNLGGSYYVNRPERRYSTFRRFEGFSPDNIVVSEGFTELSSAVSDAKCSDHRLLYAAFLFTGT